MAVDRMSALPLLREELSLRSAPAGADGSPAYTLHDPVRNRFFRIGRATFEILARWHKGSAGDVAAAVEKMTTLDISERDVLEVATFLTRNHLIQVNKGTRSLTDTAIKCRQACATWLRHPHLLFRRPPIRPDPVLKRTVGAAVRAHPPVFFLLLLATFLLANHLAARQWDGFVHALLDVFTWSGLAA